MKRITLVGGGSGTAELLRAFQDVRGVDVRAIVTTFDSGGSTGVLRKTFRISAVGDIRNAVSATLPKEYADALEMRLPECLPAGRQGHAVGNLALAFLTKKMGFDAAIRAYAGEKIIPVSLDAAQLIATLDDGTRLIGEHLLDDPPKNIAKQKVVDIALRPKASLHAAAKRALLEADLIVVGPGSLFGSVLVHFAVEGFTAAFERSHAKKVFVANGTRREFGYVGESVEEMADRFGVEFDELLEPARVGRWDAKLLAAELMHIVATRTKSSIR